MFYAKINPRTGEAMFVDMDGVPAPDQQAAQRAVQQACLMAEEAAQQAQQAQPVEAPQGGEDNGDEEQAHINNVAALRSHESVEDPLVSAVLAAVSSRGELSVSRTIVARTLQYARTLEARAEALRLSRQALDMAKDYAETAHQLSGLVLSELSENA